MEMRFSLSSLFIHFYHWCLPQCISSVESSPNVGNAFTKSCDGWRDGTYENFKEWAVRQFGIEKLQPDDEGEVPADMQKAKDITFEKNERGHFILPPLANYNTTKQRQRVVRGYIGAVYRKQIFFFHYFF
jgi:hypothetical protein